MRPSGPGAEGGNASTLARRLRGSLVSSRPGGVGAPPGDTTIPRQELADVDVRSFAVADARLWNGADTGARSQRLKARSNPHPRNARPDAVNLLPHADRESARDHQGNRRDGAPEGAPAPVMGRSSPAEFPEMGSTARRATGAPVKRTSAFGRSIPLAFSRGRRQGAARAPLQAGGGALPFRYSGARRTAR